MYRQQEGELLFGSLALGQHREQPCSTQLIELGLGNAY